MATVVHYCQNYRAGDYGFQKRRVPHDIFSCESPLLVDTPADLAQSTYKIKGGEVLTNCSVVEIDPSMNFNFVLILFYFISFLFIYCGIEISDEKCQGRQASRLRPVRDVQLPQLRAGGLQAAHVPGQPRHQLRQNDQHQQTVTMA